MDAGLAVDTISFTTISRCSTGNSFSAFHGNTGTGSPPTGVRWIIATANWNANAAKTNGNRCCDSHAVDFHAAFLWCVAVFHDTRAAKSSFWNFRQPLSTCSHESPLARRCRQRKNSRCSCCLLFRCKKWRTKCPDGTNGNSRRTALCHLATIFRTAWYFCWSADWLDESQREKRSTDCGTKWQLNGVGWHACHLSKRSAVLQLSLSHHGWTAPLWCGTTQPACWKGNMPT